ncbi:SPJ_0845 family protein [Streptococcaceae bacterium ESL0729]|nr:SPJ_0845 family protein [Streptococcaceae bacterium ESL0729]
MALTYKKRDDLDKVLSEFASFPDDLLKTKNEEDKNEKKDSTSDQKNDQKNKDGEKTK